MKKLIALLLCLAALGCLCACDNGGGNESNDGYVFKKGDVTIAIDDDLSVIADALGTPIYTDEAPSCAHEGKSKYYTYAGIDLETYPKGGKDLIYMIVLSDDTVSTVEGVRVGDSREDVIKTYGEPAKEESGSILYNRKSMSLQFIMNGSKVSQIQYMHPEALTQE